MENTNQPKSEAILVTLNKQNKVDADLLRTAAEALEAMTLETMTGEQVNEVASVMADWLRLCGCAVFMTTPQDVIDGAEQAMSDEETPVILTSEEAKIVCKELDQSNYLNETHSEIYVELLNEAIEKKKGGAK
jgi:hypothetical protein